MPYGALFQGIKEEEYRRMMVCFRAKEKAYASGEVICTYGEDPQRIGLLLSGEASLLRTGYDGKQAILEYLHSGDVFGEALTSLPSRIDLIQVVSSKPCQVQYIDYRHLIKRCPNACPFHTVLVSNALQLILAKAVSLSERLEVLSQRTIREKLSCCFALMSAEKGGPTFRLPFSFASLADYLSVDRSAMMRELKKMREEGLLRMDKRNITYCPGDQNSSV